MRLSILIFLLGVNAVAFSQNYSDIVNLNYQFLKLTPDENDRQAFETGMKFKLPIQLNDHKDYLIFGGRLNHFSYAHSLMPDSESKLSIAEGELSYFNKIKGTPWSYMIQAHAGVYSDFIRVDASHWQYGGFGLAYYRPNENICFSLGLFYHKETFGPFVIPLGGLEWQANPRLFVYALLPYLINVEYKVHQRLYAGGELSFIAETYKISQTESNRIVDYASDHDLGFPWTYIDLNAFVDLYLTENLVVYAKPGFSYLRRLEMYDANDNIIPTKNISEGIFNVSPFLKVGLSYRFRNN